MIFNIFCYKENFKITRYFAVKVEQSVITRSGMQKKNNVIEEVSKSKEKIRQLKRKKKFFDVKEKFEINIKQNVRKDSLNTKEIFDKTSKRQVSRRRLNLETEADIQSVMQRNKNRDLKQLVRISKDRLSSNMTELIANDISESNMSGSINSTKNHKKKITGTDVKTSPITVTPKSTPPKLSLTPHRSKKTPKKSPISLGSPKTHSLAIPKLLKSPRKLSLIPVSEENTENRIDNDDRKSQRIKKDRFSNISISNKSLLISAAKNKHRKSSINLKAIIGRFSKSPKIVLKSPKSKKLKLSKLKLLSSSQVGKSLLKTVPITNTRFVSDFDEEKNISAMKRRLIKRTRLKNILTASQMKDVLTEPIVLLEKLPFKIVQNMITIYDSKIQSDTLAKNLINTRKRFEKSISRSGKSAKQNSSIKLRNNSIERSVNKVSPRIKYDTLIQEKDKSSISLMSSIPREKKKLLMDTSLISNLSIVSAAPNTSRNTSSRRRSQSNVQLCSMVDNNKSIENIFQRSLFDVSDASQSHLSNVVKRDIIFDKDFVIMQENKTMDETYELEKPQTLSLRQMIRKRSSIDANLSSKEDVKKVHFANLTFDKNTHESTNKPIKSRSCVSHNVSLQRNNMNSACKLRKIETPKLNQNSWLVSPIKTRSNLKTNEVSSEIQLNRIQITPRSASIEKKSGKINILLVCLFRFCSHSKNTNLSIAKKSSTKKVPNFGRIHEKMFAKSESLVDAKKRLESRHLTFSNLIIFIIFRTLTILKYFLLLCINYFYSCG